MNHSTSELKVKARSLLQGQFLLPVAGFFFIQAAAILVLNIYRQFFWGVPGTAWMIIFYVGLLIILLLVSLLNAGYTRMLMNLSRNRPYSLSDILSTCAQDGDRLLIITILEALAVFACFVPSIVFSVVNELVGGFLFLNLIALLLEMAGLVAAGILYLSFSLAIFLCMDYPDKKPVELLKLSRQMMQSQKGRLFYLLASLLGLYLLSALSCFIGLLWVAPYTEVTLILFYRDLNHEDLDVNSQGQETAGQY